MLALIDQNTAAQMEGSEAQSAIAQNTEAQMASDAVQQQIAANTEAQIKQMIADQMAGEEVQAQLAKASEGAKSVISLKTSLDSYHAFYLGVLAYTGGVGDTAAGAGALVSSKYPSRTTLPSAS